MLTIFMSVVNVKVANIRPEYDNLKEWMDDPNNVYIGRSGVVFINGTRFPKKSSVWANPYRIDKDNSRDSVLQKYEKYIREKLKDKQMINELASLRNKKLGCWCHPNPCHGDIILKLVLEYCQ
jgi:hypothetical protein